MNRRGQNISEYGLIVVLILAVVTAMNVYCKRGVQGIIKVTSDKLGDCAEQEYASMMGKTIDAQVLGASQVGVTGGNSPVEQGRQDISTTETDVNTQLTRSVSSAYSSSSTSDATYLEKNRNAMSLISTSAGTVSSGVTDASPAADPLNGVVGSGLSSGTRVGAVSLKGSSQ